MPVAHMASFGFYVPLKKACEKAIREIIPYASKIPQFMQCSFCSWTQLALGVSKPAPVADGGLGHS